MPLFDRKCDVCGAIKEDCLEPASAKDGISHQGCEGHYLRVWLPGSANAVIGDEIDITVPQVVASNRDGSPRHFTSRQEWKRVTEANGYTNLVEHKGGKGTDKSPHTKRWY